MAVENVKAFFEVLSKDEAIQQALKAKEAAYTGSKEDRDAVVEAILLPVAKEAGYEFTLEELKKFAKSMWPEGELDEAELEAVAGGGGFCLILGFGSQGDTYVSESVSNHVGSGTCSGIGIGFGAF